MGGNLAHFIFRCAQRSSIPFRVFAADYHWNAVGLYNAEKGYVVPAAEADDYIEKIIQICYQDNIKMICAGGMEEMRKLALHSKKIYEESGAYVMSSSSEVLKRAEDKFTSLEMLSAYGLESPLSILPHEIKSSEPKLPLGLKLPLVIKDRFGAGSKNVCIARTQIEFDKALETVPNPVIQEYLEPEDQEYTVGVFLDRNSNVKGSIIMKRTLGLGLTLKGSIVEHKEIAAYAEKAVSILRLVGPVNVQLRLTPSRGPVAFEVNPRFSSTTSARALFGYNEVEMSYRTFCLNEDVERPNVKTGIFYRIMEEIVVPSERTHMVRNTGKIESCYCDITSDVSSTE